MSNLLSRLGFGVSKTETRVELPDHIKKELEESNKKREEYVKAESEETAVLYGDMFPTEFIERLCEHNDYNCTQWGARKVARLSNLCRTILDIEIITEKEGRPLKEKDRTVALRYLATMCWLVPIPIKKYFRMKEVDKIYREKMHHWLVHEFSLFSEKEANLILEGVFSRTDLKVGNPILDIFHDALRFEEMQFGIDVHHDFMRTELGKNKVFKVGAKKSARNNLTPHWMIRFQELKGVELFDYKKALEDEEYMKNDGIS